MLLHLSSSSFYKASTSLLSLRFQFCLMFPNSSVPPTFARCAFRCRKSIGCYSVSVDDSAKVADDLKLLQRKAEDLGINCEDIRPGFYDYLVCPKCNGGKSMERTLSFHVSKVRDFSMWRCFNADCGWAGKVFIDSWSSSTQSNHADDSNVKMTGSLHLEPLGEKLLAYFAERMISKETLQRNAVMQICGGENVIAFCYRQNGVPVGCKYRRVDKKKFWQERGTQKMLYGVDDIHGASEIIIVEGESDKLSMEEAGFRNCVSVPGGAPLKASAKELPCAEKDIAYQYIWNCKDLLDKASRILLATDSDAPGQALAEELALRLGKGRCWRVLWPEGEGSVRFNDANEVLMKLGPDALKRAVESAVFFDVRS